MAIRKNKLRSKDTQSINFFALFLFLTIMNER